MYFIRSQGANLEAAVGTHQNNRIDIRNPGYINIRFPRIVLPTEEQIRANPSNYRFLQIMPPTEPCLFHFVYDKDNAQNWYISLESNSFNPPVYYFPIRNATESSILARDLLSTLLKEMMPQSSLVGNKALIFFLLEQIFISAGTAHLPNLNEMEKEAQKTVICTDSRTNLPILRPSLYTLFDLLTTQMNQPETANNDRLLILNLQIIHHTKNHPELLQQIIEQGDCFVNNQFNIDTMFEKLNLTPIQAHRIPDILTPELRNTLKNYHQQRDHTVPLAQYWASKVTAEHARNVASARFLRRVLIALMIANLVGMLVTIGLFFMLAGGLNFLLSSLFFGAGALFCSHQVNRPSDPRIMFVNMEVSAANRTFQDNYPLISERSVTAMQQVWDIFEEKTRLVTAVPTARVPAGYGASPLTLLAHPAPRIDSNHSEVLSGAPPESPHRKFG